MAPSETRAIALRLERTFEAPRERVFAAWTEPEKLVAWFAPSTDYETLVTALDLRVGGAYRIEMRHKDGNVHTVAGTYREVAAPSRLVLSWAWEGSTLPGESLLTLEFHAEKQGTRLVLVHERFANEETRDEHTRGWGGCLDRLARALA